MSSTHDRRPEFWIADRDDRQRLVDPALIEAAKSIWPRAYQMVRDALRDGSGAAELLERIVLEIAESQREGRLPELHSPRSLILTRVYQRLLNEIKRNRRIAYVGTTSELDILYGGKDGRVGGVDEIYREVLLAQLLALMDEQSRLVMLLRLMDYRWAEIGASLGLRTGTVRERFRVALKRLGERLARPKKGIEEGKEDETDGL
jgi:DNA-directed RNA polymerase specialized sigma24 family protein